MLILNKKARFNFNLFEKYEAGLSLIGAEAKAIRQGNIDLSQSYVKFLDDQAYLVNANIPVEGKKDYDPSRSRKLLLHKDQIISLKTKIKAKKLTLVASKVYNKGRLLKIEIALAKSKRKFEKRAEIKKKDIEREIAQQISNKY